MRRTNTPAPPPVEAASAASAAAGKAEATERAGRLAPGMVQILGQIAAMPEPPRGSATRARCAVAVLSVGGLIATSPTAPAPSSNEMDE